MGLLPSRIPDLESFAFHSRRLQEMEQNQHRVAYDLTEADVRTFYRYLLWKDPSMRAFRVGYTIGFIALASAIAVLEASGTGLLWATLPVCAAVGAAGTPVLLQYWANSLTRASAKIAGFLGPHQVELAPSGVLASTSQSTGIFEWTGITRIQTARDLLLIYSSRISAVIVPLRAFPGPAEAESFMAAARAYRDAALAAPAVGLPEHTRPEPAGEAVIVRYAFNAADLRAYQKHLSVRARTVLSWVLSSLLVACTGAAFQGLAVGVASGAAIAMLFPAVLWLHRKWLIRTPGLLGERRLTISPGAVTSWSAGLSESSCSWSAITDVRTTPEHIFLHVGNHQAIVVPRRAFADAEAAEAFLRHVRAWRTAVVGAAAELTASQEVVPQPVDGGVSA